MEAWQWVVLGLCLAVWARVLWVVLGVGSRMREHGRRRKVSGG